MFNGKTFYERYMQFWTKFCYQFFVLHGHQNGIHTSLYLTRISS